MLKRHYIKGPKFDYFYNQPTFTLGANGKVFDQINRGLSATHTLILGYSGVWLANIGHMNYGPTNSTKFRSR